MIQIARRHRYQLAVAMLVVGAAAAAVFLSLRRSVRQALEPLASASRTLEFVPLPLPANPLVPSASSEVEAVAFAGDALWTAGGAGVFDGSTRLDTTSGLPTLRASALTLWRGRPVVALEAGGVYLRRDGRWEAARTGWGSLHVRALAETTAGELIIGAREGLFRAAWGGAALERLDAHPVRSIGIDNGSVLAAGEDGLYRVDTGAVRRLETPDVWVESVGIVGDEVLAATAAGLARGPRGGPLVPLAGGDDIVSGVVHEGRFYGLDGTVAPVVRRFDAPGRVAEEMLPASPRKLMAAEGILFADTERGLYRRGGGGWTLVRPRPAGLPPGAWHLSALAWLGSRLVAGFFDGGLAVAQADAVALGFQSVPGSAAWGVNALLPAGGAVYVASLRGAARFDGTGLRPIEGPGAAFSLASTPEGVAIGYGQGVLVPAAGLLSAFHGLPGNQALALVSGADLFVGTPSGLGAVDHRRVRWRVTQGEGKLPHPWVTALALSGETLFIGTYGGGIVRRVAVGSPTGATAGSDSGRFEPFVETAGLKVNTGCIVAAGGRIYAGTDGKGLYRLSLDGSRFVSVDLPLPSPQVTSLLASADALYIGTDEGLVRAKWADLGQAVEQAGLSDPRAETGTPEALRAAPARHER